MLQAGGDPGASFECNNLFCDSIRYVSAGSVSAVSAAPEPGTWAMMIIGFGLAGYQLRRHRARAAGGALATA